MVPAKSRYLILRIIIMPPVISHTDRIHMMYVRRPPADTAPPVPDALDQIAVYVICPHQSRLCEDDPLLQCVLHQRIDKLPGVCHGTIRQADHLLVPDTQHVLDLHDLFDLFRGITCIVPDIPESRIRFPSLGRGDRPAVIDPHLHLPAPLAAEVLQVIINDQPQF